MQSLSFENAIRKIVAADDRYQFDAYLFVQEAICFTQKALGRNKKDQKHVGGKELLQGIRDYALTMFGPMTPTVLWEWGIHSCEDFGEIVFNLIQHNQATQSQSDSRDDFKGGYDFDEAFRKPFLPAKPRVSEPKPARAKKMIGKD
jgi:uncharacterized repeat protein (TIGR04138 family)